MPIYLSYLTHERCALSKSSPSPAITFSLNIKSFSSFVRSGFVAIWIIYKRTRIEFVLINFE